MEYIPYCDISMSNAKSNIIIVRLLQKDKFGIGYIYAPNEYSLPRAEARVLVEQIISKIGTSDIGEKLVEIGAEATIIGRQAPKLPTVSIELLDSGRIRLIPIRKGKRGYFGDEADAVYFERVSTDGIFKTLLRLLGD